MAQEKVTVGKNTDYPLSGILCLPDQIDTPVPAAVFVHGSGSSDMNEHVGGLYPFFDLAEGLMHRGIASLRYDKRSYAHGRKMLKNIHPITVYEETIEDAILAVNMLKNDPRIDPDKVFLIGHSMGAMLAGRIDAEGADCAGLVMMAGIPFTLDEVLERQITELAEGSKGLIGWIMRKQLNKIKASFEGLYEKDPEELKQTKMGGGTTLYYFREMGDHPVSMYLKDNQKPILIMQGEKDFQVRADTDYKAFQEMLGGKDNVTFRLFPGLNHMFVTAKSDRITDSKNEYKDSRHIPDNVIQTISDWIFQCCEAK